MSHGERLGATGVAHPPATADPPPGSPPAASAGAAPPFDWQALFPALTPLQQQELLTLAASQSYVRGDQIPPAEARDRGQAMLATLLDGSAEEYFTPFPCETVAFLDGVLD